MDPKLVRVAKEIPDRLKDVMNSMFEQSQPAMRSGVSALRASIRRLDSYLSDIEREHLGRDGSPNATEGTTLISGQLVRRRRKSGQFPIGEFVLGELRKSAKPMRPVELAARVSEETGRDKKSALSNINTLLMRLRKAKQVTSRNGLYSATASTSTAGSPPASATKAGQRRGRPRGGKQFPTGAFVLDQLTAKPGGMRPTDIAQALAKAAPGRHKNTLSLVNTTLARQLSIGQARKLAPGIWAIGSGSAGTAKATTGQAKARRA